MKKKEIYQDFYRDMNVIIGYNLFDEYFFFQILDILRSIITLKKLCNWRNNEKLDNCI